MESTLPIIDLDLFRSLDTPASLRRSECVKVSNALIDYGALILTDSRVTEGDNEKFLDLMEDYFSLPEEELRKDERKEFGYQVGVTLENTEKPKCATTFDSTCLAIIKSLAPSEKPLDLTGHSADPKCRFFWKMSPPFPEGYQTAFPTLNMPNVVPSAPQFAKKDEWEGTMNQWGGSMKNAVEGVAEMAAIGFELDPDPASELGFSGKRFVDAGRYGPHLLAPTASDLVKYGKKDTILAGFHSDLNFLTIHGRSRYPGLHIWARNTGQRIKPTVPKGGQYLLVQAGKQLEHLSGGLVRAGYHEVVVNDGTIEAIEKTKVERPTRPRIRISSTFFWHLSSDYDLETLEKLEGRVELDERREYGKMKVGEQVKMELQHIALMA